MVKKRNKKKEILVNKGGIFSLKNTFQNKFRHITTMHHYRYIGWVICDVRTARNIAKLFPVKWR